MNLAVLNKAGLLMRILPPREDRDFLAMPIDYDETLLAIQKLRGSVYLADGAIPSESVGSDGSYKSEDDELSYHVIIANGRLQGCIRIQFHSSYRLPENFRVYELISRMPANEASKYREALKRFIQNQVQRGHKLGETGGLAISNDFRFNSASLSLIFTAWSFARIHSNNRQAWIASATERNGSAEMLRRLGGSPLTLDGNELPPFFDDYHKCQMELLCFSSETLNPIFEKFVQYFQSVLEETLARKDAYLNPPAERLK